MYKVTRAAEAVPYVPNKHFDVLTTRLHNPDEVNEGTIVHGLSHFLPGGGSELGASDFEMIYHCISNEITIELFDDNDNQEFVTMYAGDSVHFGKGTKRAIKNNSHKCTEMMTIMIKPR